MTYKNGLIQTRHALDASKKKVELFKIEGAYLKKSVRKPDAHNITIMARSPFLPYYAGADWVILPYGEYQEIIKFAKNRHVDILCMDKQAVALRPQLSFLMNPHVNIPEMEKYSWISSKENPEELYLVLYVINRN